jgi:site-specific recombinase XerD
MKHLDAEKNASVTTIKSYKYDLHKFDVSLVKRLGNRFLPGDVTEDHIRDYLMWLSEVGYQKPTAPRLVPGHSQPSGRSSNTPIVLVC